MSTTGVLVRGRRSRFSAAALRRFARVAVDPQSYRNLLYLALALPLGVAYVAVLAAGLSAGAGLAVIPTGLGVLRARLSPRGGGAGGGRAPARGVRRVPTHPPIE